MIFLRKIFYGKCGLSNMDTTSSLGEILVDITRTLDKEVALNRRKIAQEAFNQLKVTLSDTLIVKAKRGERSVTILYPESVTAANADQDFAHCAADWANGKGLSVTSWTKSIEFRWLD